LQNEVLIYRRLLKDRESVGQVGGQQRELPGQTHPETAQSEHDFQNHNFSHTSSQPQVLIFNRASHASPQDESTIQVARQTTWSPRSRGPDGANVPDGPSTAETQIACAIDEDGSIQVHGVTSHLHQPSLSRKDAPDVSLSETEQLHHTQMVKDQLFAFAALQRQRESVMLGQLGRGMEAKIELDGLPVELATHLLDLHWNRQHLAYLLTYRPAIFDSLTNDGPYASKLLLNAIYYSSCLYSDRTLFRSDPNDPLTMQV
jgi:hypothetical protein